MTKRHISIKISGTPVRKGGFIPIVNINDAFFEIRDAYPAALTREACLYSVAVSPDMTVYKLVFNRMRHSDGAGARLVIGFSVPAGYTLSGDIGAAGVLNSILHAFVDNFAVALSDGTFEYRFGHLDTSVFENIIESIELCPCDEHGTVMKEDAPRGAIEVSADLIAKTLDDIGRSGAEGVSEVLVGQNLNMSLAGIAVALLHDASVESAYSDPALESDPEGKYNGSGYGEDGVTEVSAHTDSDLADTATGKLSEEDRLHPLAETTETPHPVNQVTDYNYGNQPDHGRRVWPALLTGMLLGACVAFAIVWLMLKDRPHAEATSIAVTDTTVVMVGDTVMRARAETVFVEKKVVVEGPTKRTVSKPTHVSPPPAAASSAPSETTRPQEIQPAPQLKYDPEAERSL